MNAQSLNQTEGRKATWFELFFDLVFVTAVASLTGRLASQYDLAGLAGFAFLFLVLWWLWLGHTFLSSRFDRDRPDQWAVSFGQILAVVFIAYGAGDAFGGRGAAFAGGVAAFKLLLLVGYVRAMRDPAVRRLCTLYAALYGLQAAIWIVSMAFDGEVRTGLWVLALAIDVITPFVVATETHRAPPHPEHLPERFGLFTLILLGETAAAAVHTLDHDEVLTMPAAGMAMLGLAIGFSIWIGYFQRARGIAERHVTDARAGRSLRLWAYGHIPLYLGIGALGAGTIFLAHHGELHGATPFIFSCGVAAAFAGLTLVSLANGQQPLSSGLRYLPGIMVTCATPLVFHDAIPLAAAVLVLAAIQILVSVWHRRAR